MRSQPLARIALASALVLLPACSEQSADPGETGSAMPVGSGDGLRALSDPTLFPVDVVLNGGFELIADSTTAPPKYGAYWRGAFVHEEGDPACQVTEYAAGNHGLRLSPGSDPVSQIVTLYGPAAERFELAFCVRLLDQRSRLTLRFWTQNERSISYELGAASNGTSSHIVQVALAGPTDERGFHACRLALGADLRRLLGAGPEPWGRLEFSASGAGVLLDDVVGVHYLPRTRPTELRAALLEDVRDFLRIHVARPEGDPLAGLALVDPASGYLTATTHNATTGKVLGRTAVVGISGINDLMVDYLRVEDPTEEGARLRPLVEDRVQKHLGAVLNRNVHPDTGLYCLWNRNEKTPVADVELSPSHFINYVMDVAALFPDKEILQQHALAACSRVADVMVALRDEHDRPVTVPFGRGAEGNWYGRMPEKVSPLGWLSEPKRSTYDQAWAISRDRSWYHDFDTAVGLMRVWGRNSRQEYRDAIGHAIELFDRTFDAERYDLENDTDDHYGKNVESLLLAFRYSGNRVTELRDFSQEMTDYRLPRDVEWDRNLWVEGIRLGSFTTGDQPRAFRGPVWLHNLPPAANPVSAGLPAYRHAIREFGKSDLKRRLLCDGFMTEASSYQWEMISACFRGDYIGPCSEPIDWEGDMGDQFAGPCANGFRALGRTIEIGAGGMNREFVAWYQAVHDHTLALYRLPYGYRYGLPRETGLRYRIPERYLEGFSDEMPYGNAVVYIHMETLLTGQLDRDPASVAIRSVSRDASGALHIELSGPPGRQAEVRAGGRTRFHDAGATDWRILHVDPASPARATVTFTADARATVVLAGVSGETIAVDALLLDPDGDGPEDIAGGEYRP